MPPELRAARERRRVHALESHFELVGGGERNGDVADVAEERQIEILENDGDGGAVVDVIVLLAYATSSWTLLCRLTGQFAGSYSWRCEFVFEYDPD